MNDITLRIRKVFEDSGDSQSTFARKINVTPAYIWKLLNKDDAVPSERLIDDICAEFNINKTWLCDGIGDMYVYISRSEVIANFAGNLMKDEEDSFRRRLIEVLAELDVDEWKLLEKIAKKAIKKD